MTWPKTISTDFVVKMIGLVFGLGVLYAGVQQKIDNKADKNAFSAESAFVRNEFRNVATELEAILIQVQIGNLRLKEICDATRAGCR